MLCILSCMTVFLVLNNYVCYVSILVGSLTIAVECLLPWPQGSVTTELEELVVFILMHLVCVCVCITLHLL
eukprot:c6172_g1_i1 orf=183-395(-)